MKRKALHELYSVMWSRAGFLFQCEKMTDLTLSPVSLEVENEDFILKVEHSDFTVFLKATVEVFKRHLREL